MTTSGSQMQLLDGAQSSAAPLAERLRPKTWELFLGGRTINASLLNRMKEGKTPPPSLLIWGPPGTGKTTLARLIGHSYQCNFVQLSAVLSGVKDVREVVEMAARSSVKTFLFVDEVHRFNRAQQDAFLPHLESGLITLFGATTENPSFYLTSALLSRMQVLQLAPHGEEALHSLIMHAETALGCTYSLHTKKLLISACGGDARRLLNLCEQLHLTIGQREPYQPGQLQQLLAGQGQAVYDRSGDIHYQYASAFIKSLRGSSPDGALYWAFRMIDAGEDPRFIIRRMIIFASEDIGNADPRALSLAVSCAEAFDRIGLPEGRIPIAQCITYLASVPKSNCSYKAMNLVLEEISRAPQVAVPKHLCNAPTTLMKEVGYGARYQYPHDFPEHFAAGVNYLPEHLSGRVFYEPGSQGLEKQISEKLAKIRG